MPRRPKETKSPKISKPGEQNLRTKRTISFGTADYERAILTPGVEPTQLIHRHRRRVGWTAVMSTVGVQLTSGEEVCSWKVSYQHTSVSKCSSPALPHQPLSVQCLICQAHHLPRNANCWCDSKISVSAEDEAPRSTKEGKMISTDQSSSANQGLGICHLSYSIQYSSQAHMVRLDPCWRLGNWSWLVQAKLPRLSPKSEN